MEIRDKILEIVKIKGPVLPVQISKEIGTNILIASAYLAELTSSHKLNVSSLKVGGSPLYYLPGQEELLQKFIINNLNDKELKAFELLKQSKVLRDSDQDPVIRVALKEIKDFAIPLNVMYNNNKEIFWKWHLTPDQEVEGGIRSKLIGIDKIKDELNETNEPKNNLTEIKEKKEIKKMKEVREYEKQSQEKLLQEDAFLTDITKFFEKNNINVIRTEIIKRNSDIDLIIELPTIIGRLQYYCKAKNKKKISEHDLNNAYVKAQLNRLPALVISPGELSGKAKEILSNDLKNLIFKNI